MIINKKNRKEWVLISCNSSASAVVKQATSSTCQFSRYTLQLNYFLSLPITNINHVTFAESFLRRITFSCKSINLTKYDELLTTVSTAILAYKDVLFFNFILFSILNYLLNIKFSNRMELHLLPTVDLVL